MSRAEATLSHREAEVANQQFLRGAGSGPAFVFIPCGLVSGYPERPAKTPAIHFDRTGVWLGKRPPVPGAQPARRSGSSGTRPRVPRGPREGAVGAASRKRPGEDDNVYGAASQPSRSKRPKTQAPSRIPGGGSSKSDLKECRKIISALLSHKSAWPFAKPVDINAYPDYYNMGFDVIDLGTIKKRLDTDHYADLDAFACDLRRVWSNCYAYNKDPNADVCVMARELDALSEAKLAAVPAALAAQATTRKTDDENRMKDMQKEMNAMRKQMQMQMDMQMQAFQQNQLLMQQGMNPGAMAIQPAMMGGAMGGGQPAPAAKSGGGSKRRSGGGRSSTGGGRSSMGGAGASTAVAPYAGGGMVPAGGYGAPAPLPPEQRGDMTFDQRARISASIAKLNANNLSKVINIIRTNMPTLGHNEKEIEIDINALDNTTLWRLSDHLEKVAGEKKRPAKKSAGGAQAWLQNMERAVVETDHQLANVRAAKQALDGAGGSTSLGGAADDAADDGWMSAGDSDDEGLTGDDGGSALWQNFEARKAQQAAQAQAQAQRAQQQQQQIREEQERGRSAAAATAAAAQREREAQRAAERERREAERGGIDMMGQSNMMQGFTQGGGGGDEEFTLDEYGMGF